MVSTTKHRWSEHTSLDGKHPAKVGHDQKPANDRPNTETDEIEQKYHRLLDVVLVERCRIGQDRSNDL